MTTQILQIHADPADLVEAVAQRTAELLRPHFQHLHAAPDTTPKTRKKAAAYIGVSLTTLNTYERKGIIKGHRVGNRRLYKVAELDAAIKAVRRTATHA